MQIVWGKNPVTRSLGYVADFCPICRQTQGFQFRRIGMAGHLGFLSIGEGDLVGYTRTCLACHSVYQALRDAYQFVSRKKRPVNELQRITFPDYAEVRGERLALEDRVRHAPGTLSEPERRSLVREAFLALSAKVEQRLSVTHIDKEITAALVVAMLLVWVGGLLGPKFAPNHPEMVLLAAVVASAALVIWQFVVSDQRYLRQQVIPPLAQALKPLQPSTDELTTALAEVKGAGHKIGGKLQVMELEQALKQGLKPAAPAAPTTPESPTTPTVG